MSNTTDQAAALEAVVKAQLSSNLELNLGPFIIGYALDLILCGVMIHQAITWSHNAASERKFVLVITVWSVLVAAATTCFSVNWIWRLFVKDYGIYINFVKFAVSIWYAILDVCVVAPVQIFYLERASRIYKGNIWVTICILPMILASCVGGIGAKVATHKTSSLLDTSRLEKFFYIWISSALAADLSLTFLISYGLWRARTGWSETDKLITRLVKTSIESQLPGTLVAVAYMLSYGIKPTSTVNLMFVLFHPKVYVVSLLALLNFRFTLRITGSPDAVAGTSNHHKDNTFELASRRYQQETVLDSKAHIGVGGYEEALDTPHYQSGVDRQRAMDAESATTHDTREYNSTADLITHHQSRA